MYFVNIVNWIPIACRLSTAFFGQHAPYHQPLGGYAIYIGNTYILTLFTDMSFQTTGCSFKSSSCHTVLDSPTFLYVIILFITRQPPIEKFRLPDQKFGVVQSPNQPDHPPTLDKANMVAVLLLNITAYNGSAAGLL